MRLTVDGKPIEIDADPEMPLLWALRDLAGKRIRTLPLSREASFA